MDMEKIKDLIELLNENNLQRLSFKEEGFELEIEKPSSQTAIPAYIPKSFAPVSEEIEQNGHFVISPMVGTYYSSPGPDHPAFVKVGDRVTDEQIVCIIEAMKVMNEVKAGMSGVVEEILVDNAQPVEYGTQLFKIVKS